MTRRDWEQLPADPDLHDDLGYELIDVESHDVEGDRTLFLPSDEELLREDAFIIVCQADVRALEGGDTSRER